MWTTAIAVACIVFFAHWIVTALSGPRDERSGYGSSSSGYSGGSRPSAPSSPSYDEPPKPKPSPKDPNEGYHVTGYDAYGPSERMGPLGPSNMQRRNEWGRWEDV